MRASAVASVTIGATVLFGLTAPVATAAGGKAADPAGGTIGLRIRQAPKSTPPVGLTGAAAFSAPAPLGQSNRIAGYIHTAGAAIYDQAGHPVRFFGIDSRAFVYGPPTTACPTINWTATTSTEIANEAQWGFNVVRIALSWADLEPTPPTSTPNGIVHNWNMTYLDAVSTAVQEYNQAGIAVILDMHQSQWSPAWTQANSKSVTGGCQGTGFPLWMYPDAGSLSINQGICDFYNNVPEPGVTQNPQDGLVAVEQFLAGYFAPGNESTHGQVIGFDMLNEPNPVVGTSCQGQVGTDMLAIYQEVGTAIRSQDASAALIYEDYSFQSYEAAGLMLTSPLSMPNAIVESHAYPATWNETVPGSCTGLKAHSGLPFYTAHLQQAQAFGQPTWVGEFNGFDTNNSCVDANWQSDVAANMQYDTTNDVNWSFWDYVDLVKNIGVLPYLQAGMSASTPTVAITAPAAGTIVQGTATVTGTVSDANPVTSVQVSIGGGPAQSATLTNGSWSAQVPTTGLPNVSQTITMTATDSAGNSGTASEPVTVDNASPPAVGLTTPASGAQVSGTFTATGSVSGANPISSVQVGIAGGTAVSAAITGGTWSAQVPTTALENGAQTLAAVATDSDGSTGSSSEPVSVTDPPAVAITTPAPAAAVSGTFTVSGTVSDADAVISMQVSIGSLAPVGATVTGGGWSAQLSTAGLPNGPQTITVNATDSAGNAGTASESVTVGLPTGTSCPVTPPGTTELSGNLSVETSQSGWTGVYSSTSLVSRVEPAGGSYDGNWALHVAPKSGASGTAGVNNAGPAWVPGSPGTATSAGATYKGSAFVKASVAGEKVSLEVRETTSGGSGVNYHTTTTTLGDTGWHQITSSDTASRSGDLIKYSLFGSNFANSGQYLLADCLSLQTNAAVAGIGNLFAFGQTGAGSAAPGSAAPGSPASFGRRRSD